MLVISEERMSHHTIQCLPLFKVQRIKSLWFIVSLTLSWASSVIYLDFVKIMIYLKVPLNRYFLKIFPVNSSIQFFKKKLIPFSFSLWCGHTHLFIICGSFFSATADLSIFRRDFLGHKAYVICQVALFRKFLLTSRQSWGTSAAVLSIPVEKLLLLVLELKEFRAGAKIMRI